MFDGSRRVVIEEGVLGRKAWSVARRLIQLTDSTTIALEPNLQKTLLSIHLFRLTSLLTFELRRKECSAHKSTQTQPQHLEKDLKKEKRVD